MTYIFHTANVTGDKTNCVYPNRVEVTDIDSMIEVAKFDHVCAEYQNNYRSKANFKRSNVLQMDVDNDSSDDPKDWTTVADINKTFAGYNFIIVYSRNHMKAKNGKAARPKFHVYFLIEETTDMDYYEKLKEALHEQYPFFDGNALGAHRFFYGVDKPDVLWHDGFMNIDEDIDIDLTVSVDDTESTSTPYQAYSKIIRSGERNSTLSRFAARILKRYGESEQTHDLFLQRAADCEEPLSDFELKTIWNSAVGFYQKKVLADPNYKPPEKYNNDFGNFSLKPDDYSDAGEAAVFVREYSDIVKYSDGTHYIHYTGEFWEESALSGLIPYMEFIDIQLADARNTLTMATENLKNAGVPDDVISAGTKPIEKYCIENSLNDALDLYKKANTYYGFVMKHRDFKYIQSTVNAARTMVYIQITDLDKDGFLLNTPGLTIDLRKPISDGYAPRPQDLITKQTSVTPSDEGMDLWLDAVDKFFCGDAELIDYVQKNVGLSAIGIVFNEALLISYGEGRNGKSCFWNSIAKVMGTYAGHISAETFTVGCRHNARPEMAELKGKRLVIAAELEDGTRLSTSMLKKLCSTDNIAAERKYKDPISFPPSHKISMFTNHLPRVGVTDSGTWRRLIVIPFNAKFEGDSDIKNYSEYLYKNAGGAILKWIIEGAQKAIAEDFSFDMPKVVSDAIEKYREDSDWLGEFIEECCEVDASYTQPSGELYQEYRNFCQARGEFTRSTADFYSALETAGYSRHRQKSGVKVYGLRLKCDDFLS